jgi:hypothetical protein
MGSDISAPTPSSMLLLFALQQLGDGVVGILSSAIRETSEGQMHKHNPGFAPGGIAKESVGCSAVVCYVALGVAIS